MRDKKFEDYKYIFDNMSLYKEIIIHLLRKTYPKLIKNISNHYNGVDILILTWDNRLIVLDLGGDNYNLFYLKPYVTLIHILPIESHKVDNNHWEEMYEKSNILNEISEKPNIGTIENLIFHIAETYLDYNITNSLLFMRNLKQASNVYKKLLELPLGNYKIETKVDIISIVKKNTDSCLLDNDRELNLTNSKDTIAILQGLI